MMAKTDSMPDEEEQLVSDMPAFIRDVLNCTGKRTMELIAFALEDIKRFDDSEKQYLNNKFTYDSWADVSIYGLIARIDGRETNPSHLPGREMR